MLVKSILYTSYLDTPLGSLLALADKRSLYLLEFMDRPGLDHKVDRLVSNKQAIVERGYPESVCFLASELEHYFNGTLAEFKTSVCLVGTPFQQRVWRELQNIPPGVIRSYSDLAVTLGKPTAYRAVARAISANQLFMVIPCHRVIGADSQLRGYGGGLARKKWLITHERTQKEIIYAG